MTAVNVRPFNSDGFTAPTLGDGKRLESRDLRAAMQTVHDHMHRIKPADRDSLIKALDVLEAGFKNQNWVVYVP
jgi:hypothetical protein